VKPERSVSVAFAVSIASSVGLGILYALGGDAQLEGVLLGLALGGLGAGLGLWALKLLPGGESVEEREEIASGAAAVAQAEDAAAEPAVTRRTVLVRLAGGASAALGAVLAIPALSLGPRPGQSLFRTAWTPGARLVDAEGTLLRPADLVVGSVRTVFPEGHIGAEDAQTLLVKVEPGLLRLEPERMGWAPEGCVGYSKICTHAGCPVGLYRAEAHELLCPCHQSTFNVLTGAEPTFGPADRPLPQLPLSVDEAGYLVATGDFPAPVGPAFWNLEDDS